MSEVFLFEFQRIMIHHYYVVVVVVYVFILEKIIFLVKYP